MAATAPYAASAQTAVVETPMVQTLVVQSAPDLITRQFFGQVRPRETVDLAFEVGGTLTQLIPEEGMRIEAGARIAQLDVVGFERAVTRAELQLESATRAARRAAQLAERAAGAVIQADDAETARALAEIALADARAALADAIIVAPFDAVVAGRLTPAHSIVEPGQPILRLHDMSEVRVDFDLPERVYVASGGLDRVRFAARLPDGAEVLLRVVAFQPDTTRIGQSYRVTLAFDHDPGLLPGASVTVMASVPNGASGMAIPSSALIAGNDGSAAVLVLDGAGDTATLRRVGVTIASANGSTLTVEGLKDGLEIVAIGAHRLADGQVVRRFAGLRLAQD